MTDTAKVTASETFTADSAVRPFRVDVPEAKLTDLCQRITATEWPERETVTDESQGVQLDTMRARAVLGERARLAQV